MDSTGKINDNENQDEGKHYAELAVKSYTIRVKHRWFPFLWRKYNCYRHEVSETGHLVLYRIDRSQIALPVAKLAWVVYSNYWDFMDQFKR